MMTVTVMVPTAIRHSIIATAAIVICDILLLVLLSVCTVELLLSASVVVLLSVCVVVYLPVVEYCVVLPVVRLCIMY